MEFKNKKDEELVNLASETVIGTTSGLKSQGAQVEMMRRLKDSIEKFDGNTTRWSRVLTFVTIALLIIAIIQLVISIFLSGINPVAGLVVEVISLGAIAYFINKVYKNFSKK